MPIDFARLFDSVKSLDAVRPRSYTEEELVLKEKRLHDLERDVKFVTDELSRRRFQKPPKFCVDFDVLYAASEWSGDSDGAPFWSALLFYLDANKHVLLPGTLFEILRYFEFWTHSIDSPSGTVRVREDALGDVGHAFYRAFAGRQKFDLEFLQHSEKVSMKFKDSEFLMNQMKFIFNTMRNKCDILSAVKIREFDHSTFETSANILAHAHRKEKTINNRVDALNFTVIQQINRASNEFPPRVILVSNSRALRILQRTIVNPRSSQVRRAMHNVWSTRAASIFQLLCSVSQSLQEASEHSWELYQDLIDERRALLAEISRTKEGKKSIGMPTELSDGLLPVVKNLHVLDGASISMTPEATYDAQGSTGSVPSDDDHEELRKIIIEYIRDSIVQHDLSDYTTLVQKEKMAAKLEDIEVRSEFNCRRQIDIVSESTKNIDSIFFFEDKIQLVVEGDVSPLRFVYAIDEVRANLRKRFITTDLVANDPDADICKVLFFAKGRVVDCDVTDLSWMTFGPRLSGLEGESEIELDEEFEYANGPQVVGTIRRIRRIFSDQQGRKIPYFRLRTKYFDASYENRLMILTATNTNLAEEFEIFFRTLSEHKVEKIGATIYGIRRGIRGERAGEDCFVPEDNRGLS